MSGFDPVGLLQRLDAAGVRFVVIGGFAASLLGSSTLTGDLDVCYARDRPNLERLSRSLMDLRATLRGAPAGLPFQPDAATLEHGDHFTLDTTLGPLDLLGTPAGTEGYEQLRRTATRMEVGDAEVLVCSLDDLVVMKRSTGRTKDRIQLEELAALRAERERAQREGRDPDRP